METIFRILEQNPNTCNKPKESFRLKKLQDSAGLSCATLRLEERKLRMNCELCVSDSVFIL